MPDSAQYRVKVRDANRNITEYRELSFPIVVDGVQGSDIYGFTVEEGRLKVFKKSDVDDTFSEAHVVPSESEAIAFATTSGMGTLINDYTFSASGKTVTFDAFTTIEQERILSVTNVTDGIMIYSAFNPNLGGSVTNNVLTLDYDSTAMSDTDLLHVQYSMPELYTILDEASDTISYVGKAQAGQATSAATWQIQRLDSTTDLAVQWADGNDNFDNIWDNRASLSYS